MNQNILLRRLKRDIGLYGIALPIDDLDGFMCEILQDTTIPVFSLYCPVERSFTIDINWLEKQPRLDAACDLYIIPDSVLTGPELMTIRSVKYDEYYLRSNSYPTYLGVNSGDVLSNMMLSNVEKQIGDLSLNSITFKYEHPRKLYIYDTLMSSKLKVTGNFMHDANFLDITPTQQESFFKLAILDVEAGLYQTVKHYNGMDTPYGRIELSLDDWQNAKQERKDLLSEWDDNYLLDVVGYDFA